MIHSFSIILFLGVVWCLFNEGPNIAFLKKVDIQIFISGIFFFNSWHYYFTFMMVRQIPEIKVSFWDNPSNKIRVLFFLILAFGFFAMALRSPRYTIPFFVLTLLLIVIPKYHSFRQSNGLWLQFIRKNHPEYIAQFIKWDHVAVWIFFTSSITRVISLFLKNGLGDPKVGQILEYFSYGTLALAIGISIYTVARLRRELILHRLLYITRHIGNALSFINPLTSFLFHNLHGVEYATTVKKIVQSSGKANQSKKVVRNFVIGSILALPICILINHYSIINMVALSPLFLGNVYLFMVTFDKSIQFLHYMLDGCIFNMKDPLIREKLGPLL